MGVFILAVLTLLWVTVVHGDVYVKDLVTNRTIREYTDMQASFGTDFPLDGLEGWLVYASPDPRACQPVKPPPVNSSWCADFNCNFILLIARGGNCEFSDKVLNAERHNYAAVIVHNYIHNEDVISMGGGVNGSLVHIPSTFVGYSTGMELWQFNYTQQRYIIRIWEENDDLVNFPKFLWPFLLAMTVCIIVALVVLLVKLLRDQASKKMNRLSKKHLKKIPVRKFKKGDYYDTCAICLDEYEEGEKIRVLPCDHVYHMKCIDPWLTKNKKTCPVCKRRVIPHRDADSESESDTENSPGSENTPLLAGQTRGQSHGSITDSGVVLSPADSVGRDGGQDTESSAVIGDSALLPDLDAEHGAVGGEGISNISPTHQTLLTLARTGNIQEADGGETDTHRERKRKRKGWLGSEEEEEGMANPLLGADSRVERREKRKLKKDKKKKEQNRLRCHESVDVNENHGREAVEQVDEAGTRQVRAPESDEQLGSYEAEVQVRQGGDTQTSQGGDTQTSQEAIGHVNPSCSDSHKVEVVAASPRRDWSDVV